MLINIYVFAVLACLTSYYFLLLSIPYFRKNILQYPNQRSSHYLPTPGGGGISFVISSLVFSLLLGLWFPWIAFPLAIIGFLDDRLKLSATFRFSVQSFTIISIVFFAPLSRHFLLDINLFPGLIFLFLLIVSGLSIINFTNFMDGIDGIVSASMFILFLINSFFIDNSYLIFVGAILGFIFWNWHPAQIFMGDVGSTFLGAIYFGSLLYSENWMEALSLLLISSPIMADALICVIRRLFKGQNIFSPHKLHLYQRLHQSGWNHSTVSILYSISILCLSVSYSLGGFKCLLLTLFFILASAVWLDKNVARPFSIKQI